MTNQEASNRLKQWMRNGCDGMTDERLGYIEGWFHRSDKEAFELAISTLEQESKAGKNLCDLCTNKACEFQSGIQRSKCDFYIAPMPHLEPDSCGNYVVQQEPSGDLISRQLVKEQMIKYGFHAPDMTVTEFVEDLLPPVVQERTGHWDSRTCKCSECGYQIAFSEYAERKYKYCPNCGCRMVEQERSDKE